jgi:hypothetical protein
VRNYTGIDSDPERMVVSRCTRWVRVNVILIPGNIAQAARQRNARSDRLAPQPFLLITPPSYCCNEKSS